MADFINTIDALGDDVVIDSIIDRTITEFKDDTIETIGYQAFSRCGVLESVELPNVKSIEAYAFYKCSSLSGHIDLPNVTEILDYAFRETGITSVKLDKLTTLGNAVHKYIFYGCRNLKTADFGSLISMQGDGQLSMSRALETLILRATSQVCVTNKSHIQYTKIEAGEGYIYVPRALIEDYKVATNWSAYADQFRALEDYTVDGTTTGALDETKI